MYYYGTRIPGMQYQWYYHGSVLGPWYVLLSTYTYHGTRVPGTEGPNYSRHDIQRSNILLDYYHEETATCIAVSCEARVRVGDW